MLEQSKHFKIHCPLSEICCLENEKTIILIVRYLLCFSLIYLIIMSEYDNAVNDEIIFRDLRYTELKNEKTH